LPIEKQKTLWQNAKIGAMPLPQLENYNNPSEKKQDTNLSNTIATIQLPRFTLSWSHCLVLMGIKNIEARSFYFDIPHQHPCPSRL